MKYPPSLVQFLCVINKENIVIGIMTMHGLISVTCLLAAGNGLISFPGENVRVCTFSPLPIVSSHPSPLPTGDGVVWPVLPSEILDDHPVLLNRAPTLHRLG
ncbi:hypothetical protein QVD17_35282 [Tagetes erecta]|uniref:Uncharacterized protein n=1 Tax=Tagetes erecta TaxID=13708 RepID=A0AAD8NMF0_TARER|nr:hypothetical protein QVD17_35282 [Tagetes erecta]